MSLVPYIAITTKNIYSYLFGFPLQNLYFRAYWRNREPADICASLTTASADFWRSSPGVQMECETIIGKDLDSWLAIEEFVLIHALYGLCGLYVLFFLHNTIRRYIFRVT